MKIVEEGSCYCIENISIRPSEFNESMLDRYFVHYGAWFHLGRFKFYFSTKSQAEKFVQDMTDKTYDKSLMVTEFYPLPCNYNYEIALKEKNKLLIGFCHTDNVTESFLILDFNIALRWFNNFITFNELISLFTKENLELPKQNDVYKIIEMFNHLLLVKQITK